MSRHFFRDEITFLKIFVEKKIGLKSNKMIAVNYTSVDLK